LPVTQLGHELTLHARVWDKLWQSWPPNAGYTSITRVAYCVPPPQSAEHCDHALQSDILQLMAHGCVLQGCERDKSGHAVPLNAAAMSTGR